MALSSPRLAIGVGAILSAGALALGAASTAHASACVVEVEGADSDEWRRAALALSESRLAEEDCARIEVTVDSDRARVIFTTHAGRRAERTVTNPAELVATVDALRVRGADIDAALAETSHEAPVERVDVFTDESKRPQEAREPHDRGVSHEEAASPRRTVRDSWFKLALQGGVRGGGEGLMSPLLSGLVIRRFSRWEVGLSASSEIQYYDAASTSLDNSSALAFAAFGGRREPAGAFDLFFGGRFTLAQLLASNEDGPACSPAIRCREDPVDERTTEWRLGVYAGSSFPNDAAFRFRADLGADAVVGQRSTTRPLAPSWALAALIGLEVAP